MTKIPLTTTQYYALQAGVFLLAFVGTVCLALVLMALIGCGAPRRPVHSVRAPHPVTMSRH
jgi:hypothetical protein